MTKEDSEYHRKRGAEIVAQIQAAREAGAVFPADGSWHKFEVEGSLERFAAIIAKAERKRIVDMLLDMHAKEERHNYYLFISNIIKESA